MSLIMIDWAIMIDHDDFCSVIDVICGTCWYIISHLSAINLCDFCVYWAGFHLSHNDTSNIMWLRLEPEKLSPFSRNWSILKCLNSWRSFLEKSLNFKWFEAPINHQIKRKSTSNVQTISQTLKSNRPKLNGRKKDHYLNKNRKRNFYSL